jgi:hypothetical protein
VVLEVLGEVAVSAGGRDRIDDLFTPRPLELGELGDEPRVLIPGQVLADDSSVSTIHVDGGRQCAEYSCGWAWKSEVAPC